MGLTSTNPVGFLVTWGLVGAVAFLVFFLLLRALWLWYWRVNVIVTRLEDVGDALARLNATVERLALYADRTAPPGAPPASQAHTRPTPGT